VAASATTTASLSAVRARTVPLQRALAARLLRTIPSSLVLGSVAERVVPLSAVLLDQFVHPDEDISIDSWINHTGGPATYHDVAEPAPDDDTYIVSPTIPAGSSSPIVFGLPPMIDPGEGTPLQLFVRAGAVPGETTNARLRIDLLDADAIQVGTQTLVVPTGAFDWVYFVFTSGEADAYRAGDGFALGGQLRLTAEVP